MTQILFVPWGHVGVVSNFVVEYAPSFHPVVQVCVGVKAPVFSKHLLEWISNWFPIEGSLLCATRSSTFV